MGPVVAVIALAALLPICLPLVANYLVAFEFSSVKIALKSLSLYTLSAHLMNAWLLTYAYIRIWDLSWGNRPSSSVSDQIYINALHNSTESITSTTNVNSNNDVNTNINTTINDNNTDSSIDNTDSETEAKTNSNSNINSNNNQSSSQENKTSGNISVEKFDNIDKREMVIMDGTVEQAQEAMKSRFKQYARIIAFIVICSNLLFYFVPTPVQAVISGTVIIAIGTTFLCSTIVLLAQAPKKIYHKFCLNNKDKDKNKNNSSILSSLCKGSIRNKAIAKTITNHPILVVSVITIFIGILAAIDSAVFEISPYNERAYLVETDYYVQTYDAWTLAKVAKDKDDSNSYFTMSSDNKSHENSYGISPQSELVDEWTVAMMFELTDKDTGGNGSWILTPGNLETIIKYENQVLNSDKWSNYYCFATNSTTYDCQYYSIANQIGNYFDFNFSVIATQDIKHLVLEILYPNDGTGLFLQSFNEDFLETNDTYLYRSFFWGGAPITSTIDTISVNAAANDGNSSNDSDYVVSNYTRIEKLSDYDSKNDKFSKQQEIYNDWAETVWVDITVNNNGKLKDGNLKIACFVLSVYFEYFAVVLSQAQSYVFFALLAAILFLTIILNSLFLSIMAMIQIALTFPVAYFIYHFIFGIHYYDSFSALIVFVLLGVGADDVCYYPMSHVYYFILVCLNNSNIFLIKLCCIVRFLYLLMHGNNQNIS